MILMLLEYVNGLLLIDGLFFDLFVINKIDLLLKGCLRFYYF